jgi:hypothetical protein
MQRTGGGRNVEFHYYDWPFTSERRNCLFSSSLLRHQNVESVFLVHHYIEIDKDHNVESVFLVHHYYDQKSDFRCSDFTYGVKKDQNVENKKLQLPMAYYLWLPRPVGVGLGSIRLG